MPLSKPSPEDLDGLVDEARMVRANAYAPYSRFPVGAAVLAGERVFTGVNVENVSYPVGLCAERAAAAAAIAAGERDLRAVAVVGSAGEPSPPCGACRQFLSELGSDIVVVAEADGGDRREWTIGELLPDPFDTAR